MPDPLILGEAIKGASDILRLPIDLWKASNESKAAKEQAKEYKRQTQRSERLEDVEFYLTTDQARRERERKKKLSLALGKMLSMQRGGA